MLSPLSCTIYLIFWTDPEEHLGTKVEKRKRGQQWMTWAKTTQTKQGGQDWILNDVKRQGLSLSDPSGRSVEREMHDCIGVSSADV